MKSGIFLFFLFFLSFETISSQNSELNIGQKTVCPQTSFLASLMATNFDSVSAITMFIEFDSTKLKFDSVTNKNELFDNIKINEFSFLHNKQIAFSWYNINGVAFDSLKMFDLCFTHKCGDVNINFTNDCEISDNHLNIIPTNFVGGIVIQSISVYKNPTDTSIYFPEESSFYVHTMGASSFKWQMSSDNGITFANLDSTYTFEGVNTNTLWIKQTDTTMNNNLYRCKLENEICIYYSSSARLEILLPPYSMFEVSLNQGWNSFSSFLNPGNSSIDSVFSEIIDDVLFLSDGNEIYYPQANISSLQYFTTKKGYQIKVAENSTFIVDGYEMTNRIISLHEGWNLLPVPTSCNISVLEMDTWFFENLEILKDAVGVKVFWPEKDIYSLQNLEPGKSYFVKMKLDVEVEFEDCSEKR